MSYKRCFLRTPALSTCASRYHARQGRLGYTDFLTWICTILKVCTHSTHCTGHTGETHVGKAQKPQKHTCKLFVKSEASHNRHFSLAHSRHLSCSALHEHWYSLLSITNTNQVFIHLPTPLKGVESDANIPMNWQIECTQVCTTFDRKEDSFHEESVSNTSKVNTRTPHSVRSCWNTNSCKDQGESISNIYWWTIKTFSRFNRLSTLTQSEIEHRGRHTYVLIC